MAKTTPTIGLKTPEGSDPFLTSDFVENLQKIDAEFARRPVSTSGGTTPTDTSGGGTTGPHAHTPTAVGRYAEVTTDANGFFVCDYGAEGPLPFVPAAVFATGAGQISGQTVVNLAIGIRFEKGGYQFSQTSFQGRVFGAQGDIIDNDTNTSWIRVRNRTSVSLYVIAASKAWVS